jgi:hypothetical protein
LDLLGFSLVAASIPKLNNPLDHPALARKNSAPPRCRHLHPRPSAIVVQELAAETAKADN